MGLWLLLPAVLLISLRISVAVSFVSVSLTEAFGLPEKRSYFFVKNYIFRNIFLFCFHSAEVLYFSHFYFIDKYYFL